MFEVTVSAARNIVRRVCGCMFLLTGTPHAAKLAASFRRLRAVVDGGKEVRLMQMFVAHPLWPLGTRVDISCA
jgi:hypothetical protein